MPTETKSFCYDPDIETDIRDWFDNLPSRRGSVSEALIAAIRCSIRNRPETAVERKLDLILGKLDDLGQGQPLGKVAEAPALPDDVMNVLDNLSMG